MTPEQLHATHRWFPITELRLLEGNPNVSDELLLADSLDEFGWLHGIVVHAGVVLAGNHRVKYAVGHGLEGLPGYDLTPLALSDAEVMARALAHNHTARAGQDDPAALSAAVALVAAQDRDLALLAGLPDVADFIDLPPLLPEATDAPLSDPLPDAGDLSVRYFVCAYPADRFPDVVRALNNRRTDPDQSNSDVVADLIRNAHADR